MSPLKKDLIQWSRALLPDIFMYNEFESHRRKIAFSLICHKCMQTHTEVLKGPEDRGSKHYKSPFYSSKERFKLHARANQAFRSTYVDIVFLRYSKTIQYKKIIF